MTTSTTTRPVPTISPAELAGRLATGSTTVLDVRTPGEFASTAIDGSQHLPLDRLADHVEHLAGGLSSPVTLVCRSGQRATKAYEQLTAAGARDVTVLDGGLVAWQGAGQPVGSGAPSGSKRWELERQVRLVAGGLVLAGVVASLKWPKARFLSGGVGAGLTWAALSDTCAMGSALMRLPYNRGDAGAARRAVEALTGR